MHQSNIDRMIGKIGSFHHIMGLIPTRYGFSHYPAMFLLEHDAETNRIEIISPYFNQIIMRARRDSYLPKNIQPKQRTVTKPLQRPLPINTYLIKASIAKERNKHAVEMVYRIVALIEQAGPSKDANPNISALELVNRCQNLPRILAGRAPTDRNKLLRSTFTKTWELLRTQTVLAERYDGIQFPTEIPTYSKLGTTIFRFPHDGKKKDGDTDGKGQEKARAQEPES